MQASLNSHALLWFLDSLDLSSFSTVGVSSWGTSGMQRQRLKNYFRKLAVEDKILLSEGKGARLSKEEILTALTDRGL